MAKPFKFTDPATIPYSPGKLFLGVYKVGGECGLTLERHALVVAGSGAGKGTALIVPNLLRWTHNALVIDPGGGNVRATWQAREAMGQTVHVIDPVQLSLAPDRFNAGIPARLLKTINPLATLNPASLTYAEDLGVIADGLVMRHDPKHARWDNGAGRLIAGVMDFVMTIRSADEQTLPEVRRLLTQAPADLKAMLNAMTGDGMPATAKAAGAAGLTDIADKGEFIENAVANTEWLSYASMNQTLATSTCDLRELKSGACTVFLVIDPDYLEQHGRFLRLFVRMAVSAMARGGDTGRECLFILDEFFSLGRIDYLQKAAGLMRKNGVHLMPILQDMSQLPTLYGADGEKTFFTNADAQIFFGVEQDNAAIAYISDRIGFTDASEFEEPHLTPYLKSRGLDSANMNVAIQGDNDRILAEHRHFVGSLVGKPRIPPERLRKHLGRGEGEAVARSAIIFGTAGTMYHVSLAPYFEKTAETPPVAAQAEATPTQHSPPSPTEMFLRSNTISWGFGVLALMALLYINPNLASNALYYFYSGNYLLFTSILVFAGGVIFVGALLWHGIVLEIFKSLRKKA